MGAALRRDLMSDRSATYYEQKALRSFDLHYGQDPERRPYSESSDTAPVSSPVRKDAAAGNLMTWEAAQREYEERQETALRLVVSNTMKLFFPRSYRSVRFRSPLAQYYWE